ncbi:MAG: hypothetical protein RMJ67_00550 [Elusimicrobiota bacterium]|nr:hypothetical protein [Endomicrobiia bacterium]MDW8164991.1 hypothetical protein [Elusimicrobiota bacterium]
MKFFVFFVFFLFSSFCFAGVEIENVNVPTAEIVDYATGGFYVRMYSYGGVIAKFVFSPFNRLSFGGSVDIERLIGFETPKIKEPSFYFKWRIFDGTRYFPALALGYDGQSYSFISTGNLPAKGLFLVFTQNIFSKTFFDFGVNFIRYKKENELFGFISLRFCIEDIVSFGVEYENIPDSQIGQLNCKLAIIFSNYLYIDFIFNRINSDTDKIERQLRVNYLYKFF